jgi:AcrR family transcriptional regulator
LTTAAVVGRSRPRGETRRAQILDGATAVFLEYGYARATIELVVARIGASKATIYSFFGGKEGLFSALIEERTEHILAGFKDIEIGTVDVRKGLAHFARQFMDVVMSPDAIELYRLILAEGPRFPDLVKSFYRIGPDRVTARVAKELRLWAQHGRISADDPDRIAAQFLDTVRGELHVRVMAGLRPDDLAEAINSNIDHAVRTFWRAIRPRSARGA